MSQESSDPELNDIESALGRLVPMPSQLDRDSLMFRAGSASVRSASRGRWVWPSIAATLAVGLISESVVMAVRPGPRVIEKIVVVREPVPASSTSTASDAASAHPHPADVLSNARISEPPSVASFWPVTPEYQRIEDLVLRLGLDALPERLAPRFSQLDGTFDPLDIPSLSAGQLRRRELESLLNQPSGGPT
jgi:hypothetical protein